MRPTDNRQSLDAKRTRATLLPAAAQLLYPQPPRFIIDESPEVAALTLENIQLKARVSELETQLARRIKLDDATICAGYRRYEKDSHVHVATMVGHRWRTLSGRKPGLISRLLIYLGVK